MSKMVLICVCKILHWVYIASATFEQSWHDQASLLCFSGNNLFTITNYEGLDPSVGGAADTNFGIDVGNYPVTEAITLGVNLGF